MSCITFGAKTGPSSPKNEIKSNLTSAAARDRMPRHAYLLIRRFRREMLYGISCFDNSYWGRNKK
jgi:hypothetical protein